LITEDEYKPFQSQRRRIDEAVKKLATTFIKPGILNEVLKDRGEQEIPQDKGSQNLLQVLKRPRIHFKDISAISELMLDEDTWQRVETEVKYKGYIERENQMIAKLQELERVLIPGDFPYTSVHGLSNEAKSKLSEVRPLNLDQASRIQGIRPSDILVLLLSIKKQEYETTKQNRQG
jgi:tRNA uridine 5-carboxymethylaminomethyl modification enzyme